MRRFLVCCALGLVLAAAAVPTALADGGRRSTTTTPELERHSNGDDDEDERGGNPGRGRPAAIGAFQPSGASGVAGDYVAFQHTATTIDAFSVGGVKVFDVVIQGSSDEDDGFGMKVEGAQVTVQTSVYRLRAHDNPEGVTKLETKGTITLTLAAGATARVSDDHVEFTVGNLTGIVRGEDLRLDGAILRATDEILVHLNQPHGDFDVHRQQLGHAIGKGHVGVEASFNHRGDDDVEQAIVSYGNVTMRTLKAERGNLTIEVEGHGFDGRVLVLNVDGRVLGAERSDDLSILFDNETIAHADDLADVLDPDNDGLKAEYYVVFDPAQQAFQLIVSVPHYSVHTLSVTTVLAGVSPSVVIGVLAGVALLVPSALVLFRRGRN